MSIQKNNRFPETNLAADQPAPVCFEQSMQHICSTAITLRADPSGNHCSTSHYSSSRKWLLLNELF